MTTEARPSHPYADVNVARLDGDFPALLAHAAGEGVSPEEKLAGREGLTRREKLLFRLGLLSGLGEWDLAVRLSVSMLDDGLLNGSEMERAVAEACLVKGWSACAHLEPDLAARGVRVPSTVAGAVAAARATDATGASGLTERELFSLGLGVTWGAKCWDT